MRYRYIEDAAPARPGTYFYGACVDKVPRESNLSNNCSSSAAVTVMPPDLAVDQAMASDSRPVAGASFTVSATVTNRGAASAPASMLRLCRVTDPDRTWLYSSVGTVAVDALPASGTYRGSVTVVAPTYPREYYYLACVNAIEGESDETNNCSAAVPVTVVPPIPPPDLVVSDVLLSYASAGQGTMHICAYVLNQGSESPVTTLRYYVRHEDEDSFASQGRIGRVRSDCRVGRSRSRSAIGQPCYLTSPGYGSCELSIVANVAFCT